MTKGRVKNSTSKNLKNMMKINFELECLQCQEKYSHNHIVNQPYKFKSESKDSEMDIRNLFQQKNLKRRKRRVWSSSHDSLLKIIIDVFGDKYLPISTSIFDSKEEFIEKKVASLKLNEKCSTQKPSFYSNITPMININIKNTPNLSTADKNWCLTPKFTPILDKLNINNSLRFTPESIYYQQKHQGFQNNLVYNMMNPLSIYKFPDIGGDYGLENILPEQTIEQKLDLRAFGSPINKSPSFLSPMILSSKATPPPRFNFTQKICKPIIERI